MSLVVADHPQLWRRPVSPSDLEASRVSLVVDGAAVPGSHVDALVAIDYIEAARRAELGLGSVRSLTVLDGLLGLPLGHRVAISDLSARERQLLEEAPTGCVDVGLPVRDGQMTPGVTRTLRAPLTVVAAVARGPRWRAAARRLANFYPLAQRIVVLSEPPDPVAVVEAQHAGIGIWIEQVEGYEEHLPAEPFVQKHVKAAGWLFAENAYRAAIEQGLVPCSDPDASMGNLRSSEPVGF